MDKDNDLRDRAVSWLEHPQGRVSIEERRDGLRRVVVHPNPETFVSRLECVTAYPVDLIARMLRAKAVGYVCDEIARDEDPMYVELFLRCSLLGYLSDDAFQGVRILDFGSGSGASTVVLARMFPAAEIVGVELEPKLIEMAKLRAKHHRLSNIGFIESPDSESLPSDLGTFNYINLGAVYEHLLPDERPCILSQLWSVLEIGGVIFVNQLPYRYYPTEPHTTGLPLINFLPDRLAHLAATRWSPRIDPGATWPTLLRAGIRGGTSRSVRKDLLGRGGDARELVPTMMGLRDHADLWYGYSSKVGPRLVKRIMRAAFRAASRITRTPVAPGLSLAFEKRA